MVAIDTVRYDMQERSKSVTEKEGEGERERLKRPFPLSSHTPHWPSHTWLFLKPKTEKKPQRGTYFLNNLCPDAKTNNKKIRRRRP